MLDQGGDAEAKLLLDGQLASLKRGPTEVSMRLVEGEFPDYRGVVPKQTQVQIKVKPRRAVRRDQARGDFLQRALSRRQTRARRPVTLTVSSTSPEMGEASETLDVDFKSEEFAVGFNAAYVQARSA